MLFPASAVGLVGNQLHMHNPFLWTPNLTGGASKQFIFKYSHCFERWVGPNYLLPFQVSVNVSILGCRVELLIFTPFLGLGQILTQNSQTTSGHIQALSHSTLHSCPMNMLTDHLINSESTGLAHLPLNNLTQIWNCRPWAHSPQVFPYQTFQQQLSS